MADADRATQYVNGLRALAAFLEAHPVLVPRSGITAHYFAQIENGEDPAGEFVEKALLLGEDREDTVNGSWFNSSRRFGPHLLQVTRPVELPTSPPTRPHPLEDRV